MSTRRTAKASPDNDSGSVRTRSTAKVSGSSPESKQTSSKKKGANKKSSLSENPNKQQFMNLTPEEKELLEIVKRSTNKVASEEKTRKDKPQNDRMRMEIEEDSEEPSEAEKSDRESDENEFEEDLPEIIQTQIIPSVGKDSEKKSLDKSLENQDENGSEEALEGIGALEEISELEGVSQMQAGGNSTQYMESQELTGLAQRFRPKVPAMESPEERNDKSEKSEKSEKAESVKSDMLNNINNLTEIEDETVAREEEKNQEIDKEVEKELEVGTLEGDMGTFEVDKNLTLTEDEDKVSDEGDRVIMPPTEESKERMEEEKDLNIQKQRELEEQQLEEYREMIEDATNVEKFLERSDDSGETVEVIKPEIIRNSQKTVLIDSRTPKSSIQREREDLTPPKEILDNETNIKKDQLPENQQFTGEDVFDQLIESPKSQPNMIPLLEGGDEAPKEVVIEIVQEVYNITQEEILQNYQSRRRNQQKRQEFEEDNEEEKGEEVNLNDDDLYKPEEENERPTKSITREKAGSSNARREYTVYEDWRILESLAAFERQNGSVGLKSINTWAAMRDPLTKKKLTESGRTAESLKTRMHKTLCLLTEEEKEQVTEYIQSHSKEEAMSAYCRFENDKVTKRKKFQGIHKEPSFNTSGLQRKTPYNQKPQAIEPKSTEATTNVRAPGRVQKAFEEHDDDIEDVMDFVQESPRENIFNPNLPMILEVLDYSIEKNNNSIKNNVPAEKPVTAAGTNSRSNSNRNPIRSIKPIENHQPTNFQRAEIPKLDQNRNEKPRVNKKRKDYRLVSYPVAMHAEIFEDLGQSLKKVKTDRYFEQKSLLISDEFRIKISTEKFNLPQTDINVFVDPENNFRQFVVVEDSQNVEDNFNQNMIIEKLSQIASKYKIRQEDVHNIFHAVSNDFDDLQLYLKTKNPFVLWESSEDQDLLGGDQTAMRYLLQLKGEERIARRRQYLMGE